MKSPTKKDAELRYEFDLREAKDIYYHLQCKPGNDGNKHRGAFLIVWTTRRLPLRIIVTGTLSLISSWQCSFTEIIAHVKRQRTIGMPEP
jgi:hypothetical protein